MSLSLSGIRYLRRVQGGSRLPSQAGWQRGNGQETVELYLGAVLMVCKMSLMDEFQSDRFIKQPDGRKW